MARSRSPPRTRFAVERARRQIDACRSTAEQMRRARSSQLPAGAYRAVVSRLSPTLFDDDCADHRLRYFFLDLTAAGIDVRIGAAGLQPGVLRLHVVLRTVIAE